MSHHKPQKPRRDRLPPQLAQVHLNAAGIDIGSEFHVVAVPPDRDEQPVRKFSAFTEGLLALADWLQQCGIETVVMESTGVYWIPLFELLESRGFQVLLVDPRRLKHVPGRKSDICDAQWSQQLHTFGLLSPAFRPTEEIVVLRSYLRQRAMLLQCAAQHIQHMQKALTQMNVKLEKVLSDITGLTGLSILDAILAGERHPKTLAKLRDPRCQHSEETIAKSLQGNWRAEHLFALRQAVNLYRVYHQQVAECDQQIESHLATLVATRAVETDGDADEEPQPKPAARRKPKPRRNQLKFDAQTPLQQIAGADLTRIDGIDAHSALKIVSEVGTDMSRWKTVKNFTSWMTLCPGNKESGGKILSTRTRRSTNRVATVLRLAANSLHNSQSALGAYLRRMKARLGTAQAITATAHKIARQVYFTLKYGRTFVDPGADAYNEQFRDRTLKSLRTRALKLGYTLTPAANPQ